MTKKYMFAGAFAVLGIVGWHIYNLSTPASAADFNNAKLLCESILPGMGLEKVKELASVSKRPPYFGEDFALVGFGMCRCAIEHKGNKVIKVGRALCSH